MLFFLLSEKLFLIVHNYNSEIDIYTNVFIEIIKESDGLLVIFAANCDKYNYAKLYKYGKVVEVREKKEIYTHASTGTYYFKSSVQYFTLIKNYIKNNEKENNEFYISTLYNKIISAGQNIIIFKSNNFF